MCAQHDATCVTNDGWSPFIQMKVGHQSKHLAVSGRLPSLRRPSDGHQWDVDRTQKCHTMFKRCSFEGFCYRVHVHKTALSYCFDSRCLSIQRRGLNRFIKAKQISMQIEMKCKAKSVNSKSRHLLLFGHSQIYFYLTWTTRFFSSNMLTTPKVDRHDINSHWNRGKSKSLWLLVAKPPQRLKHVWVQLWSNSALAVEHWNGKHSFTIHFSFKQFSKSCP